MNPSCWRNWTGEELAGASEAFEHQEFPAVRWGGQYDAGDALVFHPRRRGRHGSPGLGRHADAHVPPLVRPTRPFSHAIVDRTDGEAAGVKSVTLEVKGGLTPTATCKPNAAPTGSCASARSMPGNRRHTSFAKVEVIPSLPTPTSRLKSSRPTSSSTRSAAAAPAASTCRRTTRPAASRTQTHRHRRVLPERKEPDPEQGTGAQGAAGQTARHGTGED